MRELHTVKDLAKLFHKHENTIYLWITEDRLFPQCISDQARVVCDGGGCSPPDPSGSRRRGTRDNLLREATVGIAIILARQIWSISSQNALTAAWVIHLISVRDFHASRGARVECTGCRAKCGLCAGLRQKGQPVIEIPCDRQVRGGNPQRCQTRGSVYAA